jgi:hypothetical protein
MSNKPKKNQLFKEIPTLEFVENFIKLIIPNGFDTYYTFYRADLNNKKLEKILRMPYFKNNLTRLYLPCKYKKHFTTIDEKKLITIIRQLIKIYGYNIVSREKYSNGKKFLSYNLKKIHEIKIKKKINNILTFN